MSSKKKKEIQINEYKQLATSLGIIVGAVYLDKDGDFYKVVAITEEGFELYCQHDSGDWTHYSTIDKHSWEHGRYIKVDKSYEELEKEALAQLSNLDDLDEEQQESPECTDLVKSGSKESLIHMESLVQKKMDQIQIITAILERKRNTLYHIKQKFESKLSYIRKVIGTIEIYLGIEEDIYQLSEGERAPVGTPISVRQQLLYMDEEVGDPRNGGIDAEKIEQFDTWLLTGENLKRILPEPKGLVVLRVRRKRKDYGDMWKNVQMENANNKTYVLIRNGDNLYRIWSQLNVYPRFFPTKKEFEKLDDPNIWESERRQIKDDLFTYKQNIIFLQGIIDRTDLFQPLMHKISLMNEDTWEGELKLIRDDELLFTDGRLSYDKWHKLINSKIGVGSRIIFTGYRSFEDMKYSVHYQFKHVCSPCKGLYVVEGTHEKTNYAPYGDFYFKYNPGDEIHGWNKYGEWECHERKKRVSFFFHRSNGDILNYDQIGLDDVEFYINSRIDRESYVDSIPLLWEIRDQLLEEKGKESHFITLIKSQTGHTEDKIQEAIDWWKFKNKWKRPITKDDKKAYRMILSKLKKEVV